MGGLGVCLLAIDTEEEEEEEEHKENTKEQQTAAHLLVLTELFVRATLTI